MHQAKRSCVGYLLFIAMLLTTSPLFAAPAATVEFVWGAAYAVSMSGDKRDLEKGSPVHVGDRVISETARVQLRFTDGGFVSLAPHSEFRVNAYSYSGKPDGLERVAMELIKGGLRTISGLIGKKNRSAYEMKTNVATIGIRGTEYTVVYGESVSGTVSAGAVAVCNTGGCLDVTHGQSYYVMNEHTKPVFINKSALLSPRQPVIASDRVAEDENTEAKSEDETTPRHGNESASLKNDSQRGKADAPKDDRDYDALSFRGDDDKSGHGQKMSLKKDHDHSLLTFRLQDSPLGVDSSSAGVNKHGPAISLGIADVRGQLLDNIYGGSGGSGGSGSSGSSGKGKN